MGKGCFIKFIIILTIIVAAVLYILQNHFDDFFLSPGKKLIKTAFNETWKSDFKFVKSSPQKDSVKIFIERYIDNIDNADNMDDEHIDSIMNLVEAAISDSIIDEPELIKIKNLLRVENEGSEKN